MPVAPGSEAFNGRQHLDQRSDHPLFQSTLRDLGEEVLHGGEPGGGGGREVEGPAWVAVEPGADLPALVDRAQLSRIA